MIDNLVYDVGMNNGDDTAYYLWKGYRVVAVEANPDLVRAARERFSPQIGAGRLAVLNVGIAPHAGTATFWINDSLPQWSSFVKEDACRDGVSCRSLEVPCVRFRDLLKEHGVPYYLKIDIERHERYCLEDLDPQDLPAYISVEAVSLSYLVLLANLGYKAFKMVSQHQHNRRSTLIRVRRRLAKSSLGRLLKIRSPWVFPFGSSGPFGEEAPGDWLTFRAVAALWEAQEKNSYGPWADFHAKRC